MEKNVFNAHQNEINDYNIHYTNNNNNQNNKQKEKIGLNLPALE